MSELLNATLHASLDVVNDIPLINEWYEGEEMSPVDFESVMCHLKTYMELVRFVIEDVELMNSNVHFVGDGNKTLGFTTGTMKEFLRRVYTLVSPGCPLYMGLSSEQLDPKNIQDLRESLSESFFDRAEYYGYSSGAVSDLDDMASRYLDTVVEFIQFHNEDDLHHGYLSYVVEAYNMALDDVNAVIAY